MYSASSFVHNGLIYMTGGDRLDPSGQTSISSISDHISVFHPEEREVITLARRLPEGSIDHNSDMLILPRLLHLCPKAFKL